MSLTRNKSASTTHEKVIPDRHPKIYIFLAHRTRNHKFPAISHFLSRNMCVYGDESQRNLKTWKCHKIPSQHSSSFRMLQHTHKEHIFTYPSFYFRLEWEEQKAFFCWMVFCTFRHSFQNNFLIAAQALFSASTRTQNEMRFFWRIGKKRAGKCLWWHACKRITFDVQWRMESVKEAWSFMEFFVNFFKNNLDRK
jgi:hypothetical protein